MAKILLLLFILGIAIQFSFAQKKIPVYKPGKYSAAQVTRELDDMDAYIIKNHPGFYRYTSKPDFDRFIDSIKSTIKDSLTEIETYRKFKPIIAQINCLHTDINIY